MSVIIAREIWSVSISVEWDARSTEWLSNYERGRVRASEIYPARIACQMTKKARRTSLT